MDNLESSIVIFKKIILEQAIQGVAKYAETSRKARTGRRRVLRLSSDREKERERE